VSRPLPRCAWCGGELRKPRILTTWEHKGSPQTGWHATGPGGIACARKDPCFRAWKETKGEAFNALIVIQERGASRIISRVRGEAGYRWRDGLHPDLIDGVVSLPPGGRA
jgi:hypothetical protein